MRNLVIFLTLLLMFVILIYPFLLSLIFNFDSFLLLYLTVPGVEIITYRILKLYINKKFNHF